MGLIYGNMDHTTESRLTEDRYTSVLDGSGIELVECQSSLLYDSMDLSLGGGGGGVMECVGRRQCPWQNQLGAPYNHIPRHETLAMLNIASRVHTCSPRGYLSTNCIWHDFWK